VSGVGQLLTGLGLGLLCTAVHLVVLRRELWVAEALPASRARGRLLRGLPLRLLLWTPAIALVAHVGAVACAGLALALWLGRWWLVRRAERRLAGLAR